MFEVIISAVQTGHVERQTFDTREEADRYAESYIARRLARSWRLSPRDFRVEIYTRPVLVLRLLPLSTHSAEVPAA
jgi:hypothetical protein